MLTARGEEADRVRGLATGADDYVVKPFSVPEMMARVKALLRRAAPQRVADTLQRGDIVLDRAAHRVMRRTREVRLGPTEFKLLVFFMENAGRVLSRQQLLDGVWGRDAFIDGRTVDVHVGTLAEGADPRRRQRPDPHRARRRATCSTARPIEIRRYATALPQDLTSCRSRLCPASHRIDSAIAARRRVGVLEPAVNLIVTLCPSAAALASVRLGRVRRGF